METPIEEKDQATKSNGVDWRMVLIVEEKNTSIGIRPALGQTFDQEFGYWITEIKAKTKGVQTSVTDQSCVRLPKTVGLEKGREVAEFGQDFGENLQITSCWLAIKRGELSHNGSIW